MSSNPFKSGAELEAFNRIISTLKNRLPTTIWIFESGDFVILCSTDIRHAQDSLPPNNLRYFDVNCDGITTKVLSILASKCYQRLLQHILLAVHYRVIKPIKNTLIQLPVLYSRRLPSKDYVAVCT